ncbi:MAG: hypothetical protein EPN82_12400 [Bacteroidetes bacterium]|nr:MAG: hypothetical protein EPN82_12400 [Bacteroidota bacterium]
MNKIKKRIASYTLIILTSTVMLFAQTSRVDAQCCRTGGHSGHGGGSGQGHGNVKEDVKSELIREGTIDLQAIDANKDGKVFQCQMNWNVISDSKGDCPVCNMELKEVTLAEAKDNLIKNGFEVK